VVGTLDWTQRTGGRLSRREGLALAGQLAREGAAMLPKAFRRRIDRDPRDVPVPDTPATRDAEARCEALGPHLAGHSFRTYLYGMLLGEQLGPDPEVLYIASLLHDAGIPEAHDDRCFTVFSAERALTWDDPRAARAADAITLHLNPHVPPSQSVEGHLVRAGAGLDTIGMRAWELSAATRRDVRRMHPREGFPEEFARLMREHVRRAPRTRTAWNMRYAGFGLLLR
jgi:hypothetical protein